MGTQFSADDAAPQCHHAPAARFAQVLAAAIEVVGIGGVLKRVAAFLAGEYAIGAEVHHAHAFILAERGQLVREQRIYGNCRHRVLGQGRLLDDADAIDDRLGPTGPYGLLDRTEVVGIDAIYQIIRLDQGFWHISTQLTARPPDLEAFPETPHQPVAKHAVSAENEDPHC